ncbi:MAG: TetR/AcrR family transcriptional regulator, repressor of fatR-cypB operon [Petroclostridium sp.]|jgi:AcrR family transcriptional regulator|nr:TetR/AcrR family transcriptional regulator, repressor of fatR-cypB operon [Petroclostridium sp.]
MARIVDPDKLARIKETTMELVGEHGYNGVTINEIAKKARVSSGYLYRYYKGKDELIEELITTHFECFRNIFFKILNEPDNARDIIFNFISVLFNIAVEIPVLAKFIYTLIFDQNPEIKKRRDEDIRINNLADKILEIGIKNGEINSKTTKEEIKLVLFTIPFCYVSRNIGKGKANFREEHANRLTEMCINALK